MKLLRYKITKAKISSLYIGKYLYLYKDEDGWLYLATIPRDSENIWPSVEMIEAAYDIEVVFDKELAHW